MKHWFYYAGPLLSLVLSEAMLAPTQRLYADNTWHFRWASDILAGSPIFWSGVDSNRIFPDLCFALIAAILPGGHSYGAWVVYFFSISGLSLGLALILLCRSLHSDSSQSIVFFAISCAVFIAVTTALSFWSFEIMAPGNHGASLSAVIAATAFFLVNVKTERMNYPSLIAFSLVCTFLVMSNRYLVVCFMVPLLVAALSAPLDRQRQIALVSAILLSTAAGLEALHLLNSSEFYRMVAPGALPSTHDLLSWIWWESRIPKEIREFKNSTQRNQVMLGLAVMSAATILGFWRPARNPDKDSTSDPRRVFSLITASSAICAILFVTIVVNDSGDWRYRFFVVPLCLAVITLSAAVAYLVDLKGRTCVVVVCLSALSLTMAGVLSFLDVSSRTYEAQFRTDLGHLSRLLAAHDGMTIHNGFGNYWVANEISVRSPDIKVLTILEPNYWLYNDNAWELCSKRKFSFVLIWIESSRLPNIDAILNQIGTPSSRQRIQLARFGLVEILFYDPELLDKVIVQPGRAAARGEFSSFQCPDSTSP